MDSGASKHMPGYRSIVINLKENKFFYKVDLGDNTTYSIQGFGSTFFHMRLGDIIHVEEIIYVLGLKKNLLSVSVLEDKRFRVIFIDNQALLWSKNKDLKSAVVIGVREGGLYKVPGKFIQVMIHNIVSPCELWHRSLGQIHFKVLPRL